MLERVKAAEASRHQREKGRDGFLPRPAGDRVFRHPLKRGHTSPEGDTIVSVTRFANQEQSHRLKL
jgi:hypothetical protein